MAIIEDGKATRVVALGERRYKIEREWIDRAEASTLLDVSAVAVDSAGLIYVFQRSDVPIPVFDNEGHLVHRIMLDGPCDAHGIHIGDDDRVLVVDRGRHEVSVLNLNGDVLTTLGTRDSPSLQQPFNHPAGAAFASNGDIYVSDGYANAVVHRFSRHGELINSWGSPGRGPGEFVTPHSIWIDLQDRVLVADRENDRIQVFDRDGRYLEHWGDFYHPMDLFEDSEGRIFVSDQVPRVSLLAPDGALLGRCMPTPFGAHGIWGDSDGVIYLAEAYPVNRITRLLPI